MYLLDTNALKLVVAGEETITRRIQPQLRDILVSSITAEELVVVYMSSVNRARSPRTSLSLPLAHLQFSQALEDLYIFRIFAFSDKADAVYKTFTPATLRIGPQDCRIAAQAIAHEMTVITRNLRDFRAIGASCEDWSAEG